MNFLIPATALRSARKLLTRLRFERLKLPVLTHALATVDETGITLAVTDLDHRLEIRLATPSGPGEPGRFLISADALATAARGDKGSNVLLETGGDPKHPTLSVIVTCRGMTSETVYQTERAADFPERPVVEGRITLLPKESMQALASAATCAPNDATRQILNGVCFSPEEGGMLVATDGKRLAGCPATVPDKEFVLPTAAVHVLGHPDFLSRDAAVVMAGDFESRLIQFRSGPLTLITHSLEGNFPDYRHVIPSHFPSAVMVPETRKPAVIAWLRLLRGRSNRVTLTREKPGCLTLTHRDHDVVGSVIHVPVDIEGEPPVITFNPSYLADALAIGSKLRLVDERNPGMTGDPLGNFCLIMNLCTPAGVSNDATAQPTPAATAA